MAGLGVVRVGLQREESGKDFNPSTPISFESVDEIIWCDHLNETSPAVLLHSILKYIEVFHKMKFEICLKF